MMAKTCQRLGGHFLETGNHFSSYDLELWSKKDSLHISDDKGLPLLMAVMKQHVRQLLTDDSDKTVNAEGCTKQRECPEWMWQELKHRYPIGK